MQQWLRVVTKCAWPTRRHPVCGLEAESLVLEHHEHGCWKAKKDTLHHLQKAASLQADRMQPSLRPHQADRYLPAGHLGRGALYQIYIWPRLHNRCGCRCCQHLRVSCTRKLWRRANASVGQSLHATTHKRRLSCLCASACHYPPGQCSATQAAQLPKPVIFGVHLHQHTSKDYRALERRVG